MKRFDLYDQNGKKIFHPCDHYNWRLNWLENQVALRHGRGEVFTTERFQRWWDEEEKVYQNNLRDHEKLKKLNKEVAIIVPTHFYHSVWLRSCLKSCQKTGYFTLLAYDNPLFNKKQQIQTRMPSVPTLMLADEILMKPKTWGSGVGIPHSWNMMLGLNMLRSLGFKYVYNINGDCIMERPEGVHELLKMVKKQGADIIACEYHKGKYLGTMAWLAKLDIAAEMWEKNFRRMYQQNFGNAEARMGIFAKQMNLKVIPVKNPEDHHFKPPGTKGTFRKILGIRHLHAEHKVRRTLRMEPVEEKYFEHGPDNLFINGHERNTLLKYWKTGDKQYLKAWWK